MRKSLILSISTVLLMVAAGVASAATSQPMYRPLGGPGATEALNLLEGQGYRNYKDFNWNGRDYSVTATYHGKLEHVMVDPGTGIIAATG